MIKICMNGGLDKSKVPYIPTTVKEYADEIQWFLSNGVHHFHIHFCDEAGCETLEQSIVEPQFSKLKSMFPNCCIGVGSPLQNGLTTKKRKELISDWTWRPNYISVNLSEDGSLELSDILVKKEIPIEYGVFSMSDAQIFEKEHLETSAHRVLLEILNAASPDDAVNRAKELVIFFKARYPNLEMVLHGEGRYTWAVINYAKKNGLSFRIGLEDTTVDENGNELISNKKLYEHAVLL